MPLPLTTDARNALLAREVAVGWLLELSCDEGTLRGWSGTESLSYDSATWEALGDRWGVSGAIGGGLDLVAESIVFWFDGGPQYDDASFVGRLLDRTWHQRAFRLRQVLFQTSTYFATVIGEVLDVRGFMDTIQTPEGGTEASRVVLSCETGTFRARARDMATITDADQRRRDSDDASFRNMAVKPFQDVPFGASWTTIPGVRSAGSGVIYNPSPEAREP